MFRFLIVISIFFIQNLILAKHFVPKPLIEVLVSIENPEDAQQLRNLIEDLKKQTQELWHTTVLLSDQDNSPAPELLKYIQDQNLQQKITLMKILDFDNEYIQWQPEGIFAYLGKALGVQPYDKRNWIEEIKFEGSIVQFMPPQTRIEENSYLAWLIQTNGYRSKATRLEMFALTVRTILSAFQ